MDDLDRENVREWLRRKHPTDEAGITGIYDSCPLANYLKERYNTHEAEVSNTTYTVMDEVAPLPAWAQKYVERIDRYPGTDCGQPFDEVVISAGAALDLLDREEDTV